MKKLLRIPAVFLVLAIAACTNATDELNLSGEWFYRLDPDSIGESQAWYAQPFENTIHLPGTLDDAGIGEPLQHIPFLDIATLSALHRKYIYVGPAWYQKKVFISKEWSGKHIELELERTMWETTVWVDGEKAASCESLSTPHRFDLSNLLTPGEHLISVRIDNNNKYPNINVFSKNYPDPQMREMAHGYTNHTQIKWNGILGSIRLIAKNKTYLTGIQAYPDAFSSSVRILAQTNATGDADLFYRYKLVDPGGTTVARSQSKPGSSLKDGQTIEFNIETPNPILWDEFNPNLYSLTLTLQDKNNTLDEKTISFGFSKVSSEDGVLKLNGKRIFLRGNLECAIFPLTGYPPTDKTEWAKLFTRAREYGLNHLRFHSYCPPKAAFEAADEAGFYLQVELPHWSLNVGKDEEANRFLVSEAERILREYGNHPSFILFSLGNELEGDAKWMINLTAQLKRKDNRRLYMASTFSFQKDFGPMPRKVDDYFVTQWTNDGWVRGQTIFNDQSPSFNKDYSANIRNVHTPIISHEIGQYSVFPDFKEIDKYTGNLKPLNLIAVKEDMIRKGLDGLAEKYLHATGKFATLLYKEEIERALRTKGFDGFQLLQLQDFPGQGTALVGVLNAFWEPKGFVSGDEFREFCSEVVPLARFEKAEYQNHESLKVSFEIANFYKEMANKELAVQLTHNGNAIGEKTFSIPHLPVDNGIAAGEAEFDLSSVKKAACLTLQASLIGSPYKNSWKIWVYPGNLAIKYGDVVFTDSFEEAEAALLQGRKVLLNPPKEAIQGVDGRFLPVFWSPVHFQNQPGTMGILVDPNHPAFREFPTKFHSDWQWRDLCVNARVMQFDSLEATPVVRMIDNFFKNRNMASVLEMKSEKGSLIVSGIDLRSRLENRPAARQLKYSLLNYMNSEDFDPKTAVPFDKVKRFVKGMNHAQ